MNDIASSNGKYTNDPNDKYSNVKYTNDSIFTHILLFGKVSLVYMQTPSYLLQQ